MFVAVAEEGSIHAGARRLMLTQPAVSQALRKLEREVGILLVRTPRGVELTPAGWALLTKGRDLLSRANEVGLEVRHIARHGNHVLRVGLISGIASAGDLTAPILAEFRRSHPEVLVRLSELSFANQFTALVDGEVDVAIVRPPCRDDRLHLVPLFCEPTVLCFSAGHRLAGVEAVTLDDVLDEPMIELVRSPGPWRRFWTLNELRGGAPPRRVHRDAAVRLSELQCSLLTEPVVTAASAIAWQYGLSTEYLRAVPLLRAPANEIAVAYGRTPMRAGAHDFAHSARQTSERLLGLVSGARLLPLSGADK
jgi:DNA-binding transcriptional LysR family regulator